MPHAAEGATACVLNGRLYVIGGLDSNRLQVLEMTEENGLSWSCKADLPAARYLAASCVYDGKIWVMGGYAADEGASTSVITYDAETDTWATGPPLPGACGGCTATINGADGGILLFQSNSSQYRNAAWSEVAQPFGMPRATACGSVLLG